jgi:hypothetical protein
VRELGRAWKEEEVGRAEQAAGKEERAMLAGPRAGEGKGNGPRKGLGRWAGLLSYFLSFSFPNQLKSI